MIKTISNEIEIWKAQDSFSKTFEMIEKESVITELGYQSGSAERVVEWIPSLNIWAHFGMPPGGKSGGERSWNAFGIGRPAGSMSIVCEINPPLRGINRRVAGAFVKDQGGNVLIAHRGKFNISGGMSKEFFRSHYPSPYTPVLDGDSEYYMILIGVLRSSELPGQLADFVHEVDRIKDLARALKG